MRIRINRSTIEIFGIDDSKTSEKGVTTSMNRSRLERLNVIGNTVLSQPNFRAVYEVVRTSRIRVDAAAIRVTDQRERKGYPAKRI